MKVLIAVAAALVLAAGAFLREGASHGAAAPTVLARTRHVTAYREGSHGPIVILDASQSKKDISLSAQEVLFLAAQSNGGSSRYLFSRTVDGWPAAAYTVPLPYGTSLPYTVGHRTLTLEGPGRIVVLSWVDEIGGYWSADVYLPDTSTLSVSQALEPVVDFPGEHTFRTGIPLTVSKPAFRVNLPGAAPVPIGETFFPPDWHPAPAPPRGFAWPGLRAVRSWEGPDGSWIELGEIALTPGQGRRIRQDPTRTLGIVAPPRAQGWKTAPVTFQWSFTTNFSHLSGQAPTDTVSLLRGSRVIQAAGLYPFGSGKELLAVAVEGPRQDFATPNRAPWRIPLGWLYPDVSGGGLWPETGEIF